MKKYWEKFKAWFSRTKEKAEPAAEKAWDKTKDVAEKTWEKTKDVAGDVKEKIDEMRHKDDEEEGGEGEAAEED